MNYAVESNDTEEGQGVTNHVVNNYSSIKSKQGSDVDLRELYMQTFPTCDNDMIDPTYIEHFVKVELEEGSDNEMSHPIVKKEPIDVEEETIQEEFKNHPHFHGMK